MHNKLLNDFKGVSLERINPSMPTNQSSTWQSAAQAAGFATPTYRNSQYSELSGEKSNFKLTLKPSRPMAMAAMTTSSLATSYLNPDMLQTSGFSMLTALKSTGLQII